MMVNHIFSGLKGLRCFGSLGLMALAGILLVAFPAPTQAGYREGTAAFAQGQYERAIREFTEDAEQGSIKSMIRLGEMYRKGEGVPQDLSEAKMWYIRATEQGSSRGMFRLGELYLNGEGVERDYTVAAEYYRMAAEKGHRAAQVRLGDLYQRGEGVPQDHAGAEALYHRAAEQGSSWGQNRLGDMYRNGDGVERDVAEAAKWYRMAAEEGDAGAQVRLGDLYQQGEGIPQDLAEAEALYRRAAEQGSTTAVARLAKLEGGATTAAVDGSPVEANSDVAAASPPAVTEPLPEQARPTQETEVAPTQVDVSTDNGFQVQLASYRVPGRARQAWERLREGHGDLLGNLKPSVFRIDLGPEMGVFYRLVAGPIPTEMAAQGLCSRLQEQEVDCLVWQK